MPERQYWLRHGSENMLTGRLAEGWEIVGVFILDLLGLVIGGCDPYGMEEGVEARHFGFWVGHVFQFENQSAP